MPSSHALLTRHATVDPRAAVPTPALTRPDPNHATPLPSHLRAPVALTGRGRLPAAAALSPQVHRPTSTRIQSFSRRPATVQQAPSDRCPQPHRCIYWPPHPLALASLTSLFLPTCQPPPSRTSEHELDPFPHGYKDAAGTNSPPIPTSCSLCQSVMPNSTSPASQRGATMFITMSKSSTG
ncbi:hypothetical protein BS78_10G226900 [Paspalum vaginatum]|nr:hypothetical protein BS78_10G226900 [Paspalum vaginatum]